MKLSWRSTFVNRLIASVFAGSVISTLLALYIKDGQTTWHVAFAIGSIAGSSTAVCVFAMFTPWVAGRGNFTRAERRFVLWFAFAGIGAAGAILYLLSGLLQSMGASAYLVYSAVIVVLATILLIRMKRDFLRLRAHDFCICPKCEYPLPTDQTNGRCSECGRQYQRDEIQAHWISLEILEAE